MKAAKARRQAPWHVLKVVNSKYIGTCWYGANRHTGSVIIRDTWKEVHLAIAHEDEVRFRIAEDCRRAPITQPVVNANDVRATFRRIAMYGLPNATKIGTPSK